MYEIGDYVRIKRESMPHCSIAEIEEIKGETFRVIIYPVDYYFKKEDFLEDEKFIDFGDGI